MKQVDTDKDYICGQLDNIILLWVWNLQYLLISSVLKNNLKCGGGLHLIGHTASSSLQLQYIT